MLRRWHVLGMIAAVLLATCLAAAAKLRATPKYDRIQVGMTWGDMDLEISRGSRPDYHHVVIWSRCDEGIIRVTFKRDTVDEDRVIDKHIDPRGPLERLAWLAGWR